MFHVMNLDTGKPVCFTGTETPIEFADGKAAAAFAQSITRETGSKHQPRRVADPVEDEAWQERERYRFNISVKSGGYQHLPWLYDQWFNDRDRGSLHSWGNHPVALKHYAHVSTSDPGKIAFTASPEHGRADRQTRMRPGRYLERYFGDVLTGEQIRTYALMFADKYDPLPVKFVTTADDIEHVYTNGPESCMSHPADEFRSPCHPVRVYAAGDLAVAYIENERNGISARCLCWPDKKVHGRIYGDEYRLSSALKRQGYKWEIAGLHGALLTKIPANGGYVMPYIDDLDAAEHPDGKHLMLSLQGGIPAKETCGLTNAGPICGCCDEAMNHDESIDVYNRDETWCQDCYDRHDGFYCDHFERHYVDVPSYEVHVSRHRTETWCERAFDQNGGMCAHTEEYYHADLLVTLHDGTMVCQDWADDNATYCESCGEWYPDEDGHEHGDADEPIISKGDVSEHPQLPIDGPLHGGYQVGDTVEVCGSGLVPDGTYTVSYVDPEDSIVPIKVLLPGIAGSQWVGKSFIVSHARATLVEPAPRTLPYEVGPRLQLNAELHTAHLDGRLVREGDTVEITHSQPAAGVYEILQIDYGDALLPFRIRDTTGLSWWIETDRVVRLVRSAAAAVGVTLSSVWAGLPHCGTPGCAICRARPVIQDYNADDPVRLTGVEV